MEKSIITRKELYTLVWSVPMSTLAKQFDVTDYELRKICKSFSIPLPKLGYWQSVKSGKTVSIPALPLDYVGIEEINLKTFVEKQSEPIISPQHLIQKEIETELQDLLIVPSRLTNPDPITSSVKDYIEKKKYVNHSTGMIYSRWSLIEVNVTTANLGRALRFLDTFIKVLKARGHEMKIKNSEVVFIIENDEYELAIREKLKRSTHIKPGNYSYDYTPTNILILKTGRFSNQQEWSDGKLPLESKISAIVAGIEFKAKQWRLELEEAWRRTAEQEAQRQIQRDKELLKEKELLLFKRLMLQAKRWKDSQILREYIDAMTHHNQSADKNSNNLNEWTEWARKKAEWYDPIVEGPDNLLAEVDRDSLTFKK